MVQLSVEFGVAAVVETAVTLVLVVGWSVQIWRQPRLAATDERTGQSATDDPRAAPAVRFWLRGLGLLFALVYLPLALDHQTALGLMSLLAVNVLNPLVTTLVLQSIAVIVYFTLTALFRQIRSPVPRPARVLLFIPPFGLPFGLAAAALTHMRDDPRWEALYTIVVVVALLSLWAIMALAVTTLATRLWRFRARMLAAPAPLAPLTLPVSPALSIPASPLPASPASPVSPASPAAATAISLADAYAPLPPPPKRLFAAEPAAPPAVTAMATATVTATATSPALVPALPLVVEDSGSASSASDGSVPPVTAIAAGAAPLLLSPRAFDRFAPALSPQVGSGAGAGPSTGTGAVDVSYLDGALQVLWVMFGASSVCMLVSAGLLLHRTVESLTGSRDMAFNEHNPTRYDVELAIPFWCQLVGQLLLVGYAYTPPITNAVRPAPPTTTTGSAATGAAAAAVAGAAALTSPNGNVSARMTSGFGNAKSNIVRRASSRDVHALDIKPSPRSSRSRDRDRPSTATGAGGPLLRVPSVVALVVPAAPPSTAPAAPSSAASAAVPVEHSPAQASAQAPSHVSELGVALSTATATAATASFGVGSNSCAVVAVNPAASLSV